MLDLSGALVGSPGMGRLGGPDGAVGSVVASRPENGALFEKHLCGCNY